MSSEEVKVEEQATTCKALDGEKAMQPMKEALQAAVANSGTPPASPTRSRPTSARSPLTDQFRTYAKFGDSKADGKVISLSQSDKWMKQAKVIDGKKITSTDTGIYFKKFKLVSSHLIVISLQMLIDRFTVINSWCNEMFDWRNWFWLP